MKKQYKDATEKEIISILKKDGFNPVKEKDLKKNKKGQFIIGKSELVIEDIGFKISMMATNIPKAKKASATLKKLNYYTHIIHETVNSVTIWIAKEPMKNKEKYGEYM